MAQSSGPVPGSYQLLLIGPFKTEALCKQYLNEAKDTFTKNDSIKDIKLTNCREQREI